ncbi:2-polyprenyl-6-methoxyphenol hydroxylase [Actinopolymorpha cephalotaxi]|uniref:2-polyprenyl-6-methoxyphenol hydroxylase n=1 Tax=Actinopolymorpha cephalotaxi TaxID=504797 RepID=A0A1I2NNZ4_9ACTN|nr:FAD-dependent oxidoreductase [Actinopolymorpha cephalotaxi]NYH85431.1 2-polyprenyl-6-methoxyphenol hydroxylase-like FAD-dependent oxidoreductase [Actinopolymorpha cephalotaxi]SFG05293.1 2-polyprenyl-6-methoxyphenol hydroxylase [Actinopolymorpha cephalotaxi]
MTVIQPDAGQPGAGESSSDRGCDVVVVGAGPVGLAAALDLARRGVRVRVLEPEAARASRPPIRGLGPRSLELFDDLGVSAELLAAGTPDLPVRRYAGTRVEESPAAAPTGKRRPLGRTYLGPLTIPGSRVEAILRDRLAEYDVVVEQVGGLGRLRQDEYGVHVPLAGGAAAGGAASANGSGTPGRAAYVILTDPLPDVLPAPEPPTELEGKPGAAPPPEPEPAPLTYVGELTLTGLARDDVLHLWEQGVALAPLPGGDTWWFLAYDVPDHPNVRRTAPQAPTLARAQQVFHERTGLTDVRFRDAASLVAYAAPTAPGTAAAETTSYRQGRILLAGDATGAHPYPLGGLDAGLQDVHNLGWKLAAALVSGEETALETYAGERRPQPAPRRTLFGRAKPRPWHADLTEPDPFAVHYRTSGLSQELGGKRLFLHAGDRVPDIRLWSVRTGSDLRLFDILRGPHWTLIGLGSVAAETVSAVRLRFGNGVRGEVIGGGAGTSAIPGVSLLDRYGEARHTLGSRGGNVLVVRPDGHVGLRAGLRPEIVVAYLEGMVTEAV